MPKPFDATVKDLAQQGPADFVAFFDRPTSRPVQMLNVDLSTVTTAADVVLGIGDPLEEILHLDAQASASGDLHRDVLAYNALLHRTHRVPVHSLVLLLRPAARHPNLHGSIQYAASSGRGKMDFAFEIVRLWEVQSSSLLESGLGTLPLAVLGQLPETAGLDDGLAAVIQQLTERMDREAAPDQARRLLTAAYVLTGLRVPREQAFQLFRGVRAMRESDTYQAILDEGSVTELHRTLLRLGRKRFGEPKPAVRETLLAMQNREHLEELTERLLDVSSWDELLAE